MTSKWRMAKWPSIVLAAATALGALMGADPAATCRVVFTVAGATATLPEVTDLGADTDPADRGTTSAVGTTDPDFD